MKPDVLAPIIGAMQSEPAQKLTVRLANRLKVAAQQQQAAQVAQAMPTPISPMAAAPTTTPSAPAATPAPAPTPQATTPAPGAAPPPAK